MHRFSTAGEEENAEILVSPAVAADIRADQANAVKIKDFVYAAEQHIAPAGAGATVILVTASHRKLDELRSAGRSREGVRNLPSFQRVNTDECVNWKRDLGWNLFGIRIEGINRINTEITHISDAYTTKMEEEDRRGVITDKKRATKIEGKHTIGLLLDFLMGYKNPNVFNLPLKAYRTYSELQPAAPPAATQKSFRIRLNWNGRFGISCRTGSLAIMADPPIPEIEGEQTPSHTFRRICGRSRDMLFAPQTETYLINSIDWSVLNALQHLKEEHHAKVTQLQTDAKQMVTSAYQSYCLAAEEHAADESKHNEGLRICYDEFRRKAYAARAYFLAKLMEVCT